MALGRPPRSMPTGNARFNASSSWSSDQVTIPKMRLLPIITPIRTMGLPDKSKKRLPRDVQPRSRHKREVSSCMTLGRVDVVSQSRGDGEDDGELDTQEAA